MKKHIRKTALIIGAGPAGLTAAYELLKRTGITPIIIEKELQAGGLSATLKYKGNRYDIGPHRFFSKSERVNKFWLSIFSLEKKSNNNKHVFQKINRKTQILFRNKLFDYPLSLNAKLFINLGFKECVLIAYSFVKSQLVKPKIYTLEDFYISRFGKRLYQLFFEKYTEKLWGIPCSKLSPDWGAQRVKGISVWTVLIDALQKTVGNIIPLNHPKKVETSLIDNFIYPKLGVGDFWQYLADKIVKMGGDIKYGYSIKSITIKQNKVSQVIVTDKKGNNKHLRPDYFFSSMPLNELIESIDSPVPKQIKQIAGKLFYRDMVLAGISVKLRNITPYTKKETFSNNWLYIHEDKLRVIRMQVYGIWGREMINDKNNIWIGLEHCCNQGDEYWNLPDDELERMAIDELIQLKICRKEDIKECVIKRIHKAYPVYIEGYKQIDKVQRYIDSCINLYAIGRNGMHHYNNMDHSMLSAMLAVDSLIDKSIPKNQIWEVNTEKEYHEVKYTS